MNVATQKSHYQDEIDMAATRLPEQKIILCGEYGAGKSSIFRRYTNDTFVTSTDRSSTLGLDHFSKSFTSNEREVKVIDRHAIGLSLYDKIIMCGKFTL